MREYTDIYEEIGRNAKDILHSTGDIHVKKAEGCLLAILCELLLDIRESLSVGTIVPSCEVVDK